MSRILYRFTQAGSVAGAADDASRRVGLQRLERASAQQQKTDV